MQLLHYAVSYPISIFHIIFHMYMLLMMQLLRFSSSFVLFQGINQNNILPDHTAPSRYRGLYCLSFCLYIPSVIKIWPFRLF